jgi:hypothetical protein
VLRYRADRQPGRTARFDGPFFYGANELMRDHSYTQTIQSLCGSEQITLYRARTIASFATPEQHIMKHNAIRTSMFIAAMLAASAAFAGADIVKCVDQEGHVTLTDSHCSAAAEKVVVVAVSEDTPAAAPDEMIAAPAAPAAPAVRRMTVQRDLLPPAQPRQTNWSTTRPPSRALARDVETLKAARSSMKVLDEASATLKHQRLAGLN